MQSMQCKRDINIPSPKGSVSSAAKAGRILPAGRRLRSPSWWPSGKHPGMCYCSRLRIELVAAVRAKRVVGRALAPAPRAEVANGRLRPSLLRHVLAESSCDHVVVGSEILFSVLQGRQLRKCVGTHGAVLVLGRRVKSTAAGRGTAPQTVGEVIFWLLEARRWRDARAVLHVLLDRLEATLHIGGLTEGLCIDLLRFQQHLVRAGLLLLLGLLHLGDGQKERCLGSHS
mmetsp:Transcript_105792/g.252349  ORF Transcript_105792/g.252349 Transcript_105792/m.252349 type:complete len:229 (+) Transcript_105792:134-820(+)